MSEQRIDYKILGDICLDCGDFLENTCVKCEDCSVYRLKIRSMKALNKEE